MYVQVVGHSLKEKTANQPKLERTDQQTES
jgi:hypothetical protein